MSGFARTLILGIGLLGVFILSVLVTGLIVLKKNGTLDEMLRKHTLSEREQTILAQVESRPVEAPPVQPRDPEAEVEQTIARIASKMNETNARELLNRLSQREVALDERANYIAQQEAELQLAQAELERLRQQFNDRQSDIEGLIRQLGIEREEYAALRAEELRQVSILGEVERKQWAAVAQRYSAMRRPWDLMRELPVEDIAHILSFMEEKKSAKILDAAIADRARQELPLQIHRRLMTLDVDGLSGNQAQRLANLYQYMRPAQVMPYLQLSSVDEVAQIVWGMPLKKQEPLLKAMMAEDPARTQEIQLRLKELDRGAQGQGGAL